MKTFLSFSYFFSLIYLFFLSLSSSLSSSLKINLKKYQNLNQTSIIELYKDYIINKKKQNKQQSELELLLNELLYHSYSNQNKDKDNIHENENENVNQPKHILTIMSDDQGWNDIGYHDSTFVTPVVDHLANNGVILNNFYVQCTCTPTRASMITGKYVTKTGLQDGALLPGESRHLPRSFKTIGQYFKEADYSTYFLGKWHLGLEYTDLLPNARGYDYFYGSIGGVINHYTKEIGLACGEPGDKFSNIYGIEDCKLLNGYDLQENGIPYIEQDTYNSFLQASKATNIISNHNSSIPMLMHYHPNEPHAPLQVPNELYELCHDVSLPESNVSPHNRQILCGMVTSIDISILQILLSLYFNNNMLKNTLIIYHSDNGGWIQGGSINQPFKGEKGTVFEGGIHVPAFMYGNGLSDVSNTIRNDLVHVSDILPTLLSYANIKYLTNQFDGISYWESLITSQSFNRYYIPLNTASSSVYYFTVYIEVISNITYKYLYNPSVILFLTTATIGETYVSEGEFLYNLTDDISETINLLDNLQNNFETQALLKYFHARVLELQSSSDLSQLEVIPPKIEVYPSSNNCWLPKDSIYFYNFTCPNSTNQL